MVTIPLQSGRHNFLKLSKLLVITDPADQNINKYHRLFCGFEGFIVRHKWVVNNMI